MALQAEVDSLDGVAEPLREHYVEADGRFRLAVEGIDDAKELKATLTKVRGELRDARAALKPFDGFGADDITELDELRAMREKFEASKGDLDEALASQRDRLEKRYSKDVGKLTEERDTLNGKLTEVLRTNEAVRALNDAGGIVEAMLHHVEQRARFDADFQVVAEGLEGEEVTIPELVAQMKTSGKYDWGFRPNGGAGGGAEGRKGRAGGSGVIRSRKDFTTNAARAAYIKEHGKEAYLALPD